MGGSNQPPLSLKRKSRATPKSRMGPGPVLNLPQPQGPEPEPQLELEPGELRCVRCVRCVALRSVAAALRLRLLFTRIKVCGRVEFPVVRAGHSSETRLT